MHPAARRMRDKAGGQFASEPVSQLIEQLALKLASAVTTANASLDMYIRFVVGLGGENHRWLTGIITEARLLHDRGELERYQGDLLEETYQWLNDQLPCPPFSTNDWGPEAVSWFKDTAEEPIKKMWDIVSLLQEYGIRVRVLRSKNPGKILYDDEFQIVEWKCL